MPPFAVRARWHAAAHFDWDDILHLNLREGHAAYQSEYTGGKDRRAYAVTIHGEIRGEGASLEEAEVRMANALRAPLPVLAVASNAAVGEMLLVASHGLDLFQPQPFVGYWTPAAEEWLPPGDRRIDLAATRALLEAVVDQSQAEVLLRAYEAYRRALSHWFPEELLLAGEFLYVAAETLSRFLIEQRAENQGMTPKNLAKLEHAGGPDSLRSRYLRDEIFAGDAAAFEAMNAASNGFEHGYLSIAEVRGLFQGTLAHSMGLVRRALIEAAQPPDVAKETLLHGYDEPRGLPPTFAFVRGNISAVDPSNPPVLDGGAIELDWKRPQVSVTTNSTGEPEINIPLNATVTDKPDDVELKLTQVAVRAGYSRFEEPVQASSE